MQCNFSVLCLPNAVCFSHIIFLWLILKLILILISIIVLFIAFSLTLTSTPQSHTVFTYRFFKKRLSGRWSMKIWWRIFVRVMLSSWMLNAELRWNTCPFISPNHNISIPPPWNKPTKGHLNFLLYKKKCIIKVSQCTLRIWHPNPFFGAIVKHQ